jgi:hypothetical protein
MGKPFYFPLLFLTPDFEGDQIGTDELCIIRRRWNHAPFDFATLATQHELHIPYQMMDVLLARCSLEMRISTCDTHEEAIRVMSAMRLGLYAARMSPFLSPFVATHSLNEYAGINARESKVMRSKLSPELQKGVTSETGKVEVWPWEMSLQCITVGHKLNATGLRLESGVRLGKKWLEIVNKKPALKVAEDAANDAPKLGNHDQSLLHVWTAIEGLFPSVSQEVSFRLALYLAQLYGSPNNRKPVYEHVKKAYGVRSKVAHGSLRGINMSDWHDAWEILMSAVTAIVQRGTMPSEAELLEELLAAPAQQGSAATAGEQEDGRRADG